MTSALHDRGNLYQGSGEILPVLASSRSMFQMWAY